MKLAITQKELKLILNALILIKDKKSEDPTFNPIFKSANNLYERFMHHNISDIDDVDLSNCECKTILFSLYYSAPEKSVPTPELADLIFMIVYESKVKP